MDLRLLEGMQIVISEWKAGAEPVAVLYASINVLNLMRAATGSQLMCFGYIPSPGHLERPTSEIGFKPEKWNTCDVQ